MIPPIDSGRRRLLLGSATALAAFSLSSRQPAQAHVRFQRSIPAANQSLAAAPAEIVLVFSDKVQPALSQIIVTDAAGARVDQSLPSPVGGDAARLAVTLKPLPAGRYEVSWAATCIYNHRLRGSFGFTVQS
ncbi:hypothetical protein ASE63_23365 [Bosea sp. Root381]|uniref:copper resistance CopC family protein n=1 Tax=Bosea sp. Root381 TaxID=1736524 RepID=UPI0006FD74EA|nr:copper resistance CopC family protein [Bosea sp. Root381]KRE06899.1 hypothetical protein ASE63_23365 [Bosea sp. Root381]